MLKVAIAVVYDSQSRVLILKRSSRCKDMAGAWNFPGGKIDENESNEVAARRELREEGGIDLPIDSSHFLLTEVDNELQLEKHFYLIKSDDCEPNINEESDIFSWATIEELRRLHFVVIQDSTLDEIERNI